MEKAKAKVTGTYKFPKKYDLPPEVEVVKKAYRGQGYLRSHTLAQKDAAKKGLRRPD